MRQRLISEMRRAIGLYRPGRNLDVWPNNVLLSFPKSGNTWNRFLIANLVYPETPVDFSKINRLTPDPEALSKREWARKPRPRIIKSHKYFDPRCKRVIYVVRDPREWQCRGSTSIASEASSRTAFRRRFVARFVAGETRPYGSWGENVAGWLAERQNRPGFPLLRYEDMLEDTARELNKVASFLEIPPNEERIANAVRRIAADEMRKLQNSQAHRWSSTKDARKDVPFVRSAEAGGWRTGLPQGVVAQLEAAWGYLITYLGYELLFPGTTRTTTLQSPLLEATFNGPLL
jgi:estrone sulfotransferase